MFLSPFSNAGRAGPDYFLHGPGWPVMTPLVGGALIIRGCFFFGQKIICGFFWSTTVGVFFLSIREIIAWIKFSHTESTVKKTVFN